MNASHERFRGPRRDAFRVVASDVRFGPGAAWTLRGSFAPLASGQAIDGFAPGGTIVVEGIAEAGSAEVRYFHVEPAALDVLLAEGLPVESYLDSGDRAKFSGGMVTPLYPDFAARGWQMKGCAKLVTHGLKVDAVRASIAAEDWAAVPRARHFSLWRSASQVRHPPALAFARACVDGPLDAREKKREVRQSGRVRSCVRPVGAAAWPLAQMGSAIQPQTSLRLRKP
jgi:hypothetical protein